MSIDLRFIHWYVSLVARIPEGACSSFIEGSAGSLGVDRGEGTRQTKSQHLHSL